MSTITAPRIDVHEARREVMSGEALLVCAYEDEDDARCAQIPLEGSITFSELEARLPSLRKDTGIIFYCT
jgi:hypothetical protein